MSSQSASINGVKISRASRGKGGKRRRHVPEQPEPTTTRYGAAQLDRLALRLVTSGVCSVHILDRSAPRRMHVDD